MSCSSFRRGRERWICCESYGYCSSVCGNFFAQKVRAGFVLFSLILNNVLSFYSCKSWNCFFNLAKYLGLLPGNKNNPVLIVKTIFSEIGEDKNLGKTYS